MAAFQKAAGIRFRSLELLNLSFVHRSSSNEHGSKSNNERLEFLGDAVLGAVAATMLFERMGDRPEGELARVKSVVVSEAGLSGLALSLNVDSLLILGKGEAASGGRTKKAILADALEALIGALYLDSGYKAAFDFVSRILDEEISSVLENRHKKDYKTLLQEHCQRSFHSYPQYTLVKRSGPDHDRMFWVEAAVEGVSYGTGAGKNKKDAEQAAARLAYQSLCPDMESPASK